MDGNREYALKVAKEIGMNLGEEIIVTVDGGVHQHAKGGKIHHDGYLVRKTGPYEYTAKKVHSDD